MLATNIQGLLLKNWKVLLILKSYLFLKRNLFSSNLTIYNFTHSLMHDFTLNYFSLHGTARYCSPSNLNSGAIRIVRWKVVMLKELSLWKFSLIGIAAVKNWSGSNNRHKKCSLKRQAAQTNARGINMRFKNTAQSIALNQYSRKQGGAESYI